MKCNPDNLMYFSLIAMHVCYILFEVIVAPT